MVIAGHVENTGNRIEWPKSTVKADGIYVSTDCSMYGVREQRMAISTDNS